MDIECKLKRVGGTLVDMITKTYHFAPREDGAHVADVEDVQHQDRFLAIPEAYGIYRGSAAAPVAAPVSQMPATTDQAEAEKNTGGTPSTGEPVHDVLYGSSTHPSTFEIHGKTYTLGDIVGKAHAASGLDVQEWNELAEETRADMIDEQLDALNEAGPAKDEAAEREELAAQYEAKFGKKPHYNLGIEKLRAALAGE